MHDDNPYSAPQTPVTPPPRLAHTTTDEILVVDWLAIPGMREVARGLALCYFSSFVILLQICFVLLALISGPLNVPAAIIIFIFLGSQLFFLTGLFRCLSVPWESGARIPAWIAFVGVLATNACIVFSMRHKIDVTSLALYQLSLLGALICALIGAGGILCFLKYLAAYLRHPLIKKRVSRMLVLLAAAGAGFLVMYLYVNYLQRQHQLWIENWSRTVTWFVFTGGTASVVAALLLGYLSYWHVLYDMNQLIQKGKL